MLSFYSKRSSEVTEPVVIPVVEETIELGHRVVDTGRGVRVTKHVTEREAHIEDPLMHEDVTVERVPIDMLINGPEPKQHYEGDTLVIPVLEEVLVLEKRVRLKEEVRVTRRVHRENSTQHVRLNSEDVSIEEFDEGTQGDRHG
jgi:stress response protein YsnF